jgi:ABC-2 type transport system permease protein
MAQGFGYVFLPDALKAQQAAGQWELGRIALVLGAWCVIGLVLCLMTFRWTERDR